MSHGHLEEKLEPGGSGWELGAHELGLDPSGNEEGPAPGLRHPVPHLTTHSPNT